MNFEKLDERSTKLAKIINNAFIRGTKKIAQEMGDDTQLSMTAAVVFTKCSASALTFMCDLMQYKSNDCDAFIDGLLNEVKQLAKQKLE